MKDILPRLQVRTYDILTRPRSPNFIKRLQAYLLGTYFFLLLIVLVWSNIKTQPIALADEGLAIGMLAPANLVAYHDIEFPLLDEYEKARQEAGRQAPMVFTRDFSVLKSNRKGESSELESEMALQLQGLQACRQDQAPQNCLYRMEPFRFLGRADLDNILLLDDRTTGNQLRQVLAILFRDFIILKDPPPAEQAGNLVSVVNTNTGAEAETTNHARDSILLAGQLRTFEALRRFQDTVAQRLPQIAPEVRFALIRLSVHYLSRYPAVVYNPELSEKARQEAMGKVLLNQYIYRIKRGETILKQGEIITERKLTALEMHSRAGLRDAVARSLTILLQQGILLAFLIYFAKRFVSRRFGNITSNLLVFFNLLLFLLVLSVQISIWDDNANVNEVTYFFGVWFPIAVFTLLFSILLGEVIAVPMSIYLALIIFTAARFDGNSLLIVLVTGMLGAIMGTRLNRRSDFISTAIILAAVNVIMVTVAHFFNNRPFLGTESLFAPAYVKLLLASLYSTLPAGFVILILPVYESLFHIPTRFRLAELADPSHPLLKDLFSRAPSTWNHTLMVAALSEKACQRLNLDTILTRTGVYYHDIGKMKNAGFFVENQHLIPKIENIDKNNPHLAAKTIIDHVLDGITMARHARLPVEVIDFIPEHHGTSTMAFFYHKALEKMKRKVNREDFRYPGPRPQRKETAIVMLADSLEAASRSLTDVNQESVDQLIQKIINIKLAENQLDECNLTIGELTVIKEAFRDVLLSSLHSRPQYPSSESTTALEQKQKQRPKRRS